MSTYRNAMDKTTLREEKKNELKEMYNQQPKNNVTEIKKKSIVKPVSVIAASLAVIIALGAFFTFGIGTKKDNSFVLSVNAAEVSKTKSAYIEMGEKSLESLLSVDYKNNAEVIYPIYLKCKGEEIDTVTYSVDRGAFEASLRIDQNKIKEGVSAPYGKYQVTIPLDGENSVTKYYTSFTVAYKDQPEPWNYFEDNDAYSTFLLSLVVNSDDLSEDTRERVSEYCKELNGENAPSEKRTECVKNIYKE
ncbi:MAG: hypothetical protein ACI4HM_10415, partial [Ruminococcus sp.]